MFALSQRHEYMHDKVDWFSWKGSGGDLGAGEGVGG